MAWRGRAAAAQSFSHRGYCRQAVMEGEVAPLPVRAACCYLSRA